MRRTPHPLTPTTMAVAMRCPLPPTTTMAVATHELAMRNQPCNSKLVEVLSLQKYARELDFTLGELWEYDAEQLVQGTCQTRGSGLGLGCTRLE